MFHFKYIRLQAAVLQSYLHCHRNNLSHSSICWAFLLKALSSLLIHFIFSFDDAFFIMSSQFPHLLASHAAAKCFSWWRCPAHCLCLDRCQNPLVVHHTDKESGLSVSKWTCVYAHQCWDEERSRKWEEVWYSGVKQVALDSNETNLSFCFVTRKWGCPLDKRLWDSRGYLTWFMYTGKDHC